VLIVEDEAEMLRGLQDNFVYEGFDVLQARDGESGVRQALEQAPDIIILDVMLPKISGLDVCRRLRAQGVQAPILMLTARSEEMDKVIGLEVGADDYITKPFSIKELLARTRAQLRRYSSKPKAIATYTFGDVELDFRRYRALKTGRAVEMSPREFDLLKHLIVHEGEVISRDQLLNEVWGYNEFPLTRTVDNHVAKLRQKLEDEPADPQHIITVHRLGYKFVR
jgi:two-component system alkaline phosphatase synthesis response regulator PhoP